MELILYILSVVISFMGLIYIISIENDVRLSVLFEILVLSLIPFFNIAIMMAVVIESGVKINRITIKKRK